MLAKAVGQSTSVFDDPPPSRASPLPQGFVLYGFQWESGPFVITGLGMDATVIAGFAIGMDAAVIAGFAIGMDA
ncbi:hypothetical protein PMI28_04958, partial [Pseudomonas sp. GM48]